MISGYANLRRSCLDPLAVGALDAPFSVLVAKDYQEIRKRWFGFPIWVSWHKCSMMLGNRHQHQRASWVKGCADAYRIWNRFARHVLGAMFGKWDGHQPSSGKPSQADQLRASHASIIYSPLAIVTGVITL